MTVDSRLYTFDTPRYKLGVCNEMINSICRSIIPKPNFMQ